MPHLHALMLLSISLPPANRTITNAALWNKIKLLTKLCKIDLCVLPILHRCTWFSFEGRFSTVAYVHFHHPASSGLKALPRRCTWLYLRLTCLPYVISKPLSAWSWMGTKERPPLMINCSKSPGFCIPMVPRLSGHHVTCSQHFSSRLGES